MSVYAPPSKTTAIYNSENFTVTQSDYITQSDADRRYLRFPSAQGTEALQSITVSGTADFASTVDLGDNQLQNISTIAFQSPTTTTITSDAQAVLFNATNNNPYQQTQPQYKFNTRIDAPTASPADLELNGSGSIKVYKGISNTIPTSAAEAGTVTSTLLTNTLPYLKSAINYGAAFFTNKKSLTAALEQTGVGNALIYIEDFSTTTVNSFDINNVAVPATYPVALSTIYIKQIFPVYYNSATDCKFIVICASGAVNIANFYVLTCVGNPLLAASYTWSPNYIATNQFGGASINVTAAGSSGYTAGQLPTFSNGSGFIGQRAFCSYDASGDLLLWSGAGSGWSTPAANNNFFAVSNTSLTRGINIVNNYASSSVPALTNSNRSYGHFYDYTNAGLFLWNSGSTTVGLLQLTYFDRTTGIHTQSDLVNVVTAVGGTYEGCTLTSAAYQPSYVFESGNVLYAYILYANNVNVAGTKDVRIAVFSWNRATGNGVAPTYVTNYTIDTMSFAVTFNTQLLFTTYSMQVNSLNNIETCSPEDNNAVITYNAYSSTSTITVTNLRGALNNVLGIGVAFSGSLAQAGAAVKQKGHGYFRTAGGIGTALSTAYVTFNSANDIINYLSTDYDRTNTLSQITGGAGSSRVTTWSSGRTRIGAAGTAAAPTNYYESDSASGNTIQGVTTINTNASGATNLTLTQFSGATSTPVLSVRDTASFAVNCIPRASGATYNPLVATGDAVISAAASQSLVLTTNIATNNGIRVSSTKSRMGAGGAGTSPTYYFESDITNGNYINSGVNVNGNITNAASLTDIASYSSLLVLDNSNIIRSRNNYCIRLTNGNNQVLNSGAITELVFTTTVVPIGITTSSSKYFRFNTDGIFLITLNVVAQNSAPDTLLHIGLYNNTLAQGVIASTISQTCANTHITSISNQILIRIGSVSGNLSTHDFLFRTYTGGNITLISYPAAATGTDSTTPSYAVTISQIA